MQIKKEPIDFKRVRSPCSEFATEYTNYEARNQDLNVPKCFHILENEMYIKNATPNLKTLLRKTAPLLKVEL